MNNNDYQPIKKNNNSNNNENFNNQMNNLNNNQQPIYFGNSLSGNNNPNNLNQINNVNKNTVSNINSNNQNNNQLNSTISNNTSEINNYQSNQQVNIPQNDTNINANNLNNSIDNNTIHPSDNNINYQNINLENQMKNNTPNNEQSSINDKNEKVIKNLKNDMLILGFLSLFVIITSFFSDEFTFSNVVIYILDLIFIVIAYLGALDKEWYAGKIGMMIGIKMLSLFLFSNIIDAIIEVMLGIFVVIHSVKYSKLIKSNWKQTLKVVLSFIGVYLIVLLGVAGLEIFNSKVQCTRANGDKVVVRFDSEGISKMTINGELPSNSDYALYKLNFIHKFVLIKMKDEDVIDEYKEAVKEYEEEENGAVCK